MKKLRDESGGKASISEETPVSGVDLSPIKKEDGSNKRTQVDDPPESAHVTEQQEIDLTQGSNSSSDSLSDRSAIRTLFEETEDELKVKKENKWEIQGKKNSSGASTASTEEREKKASQRALSTKAAGYGSFS